MTKKHKNSFLEDMQPKNLDTFGLILRQETPSKAQTDSILYIPPGRFCEQVQVLRGLYGVSEGVAARERLEVLQQAQQVLTDLFQETKCSGDRLVVVGWCRCFWLV